MNISTEPVNHHLVIHVDKEHHGLETDNKTLSLHNRIYLRK